MTRVTVERARDDDRVQVLHVEQPSMVGNGFDSGRDLAGLSMAACGNIGRGDEFDVGHVEKLAHQLLAAGARPDDSEPDTIVCAQHASTPISKSDRRSGSRLFQKLSTLD